MSALPDFLQELHKSLPPTAQKYLTRENLQTLMRVVVIIATYLLFRPHLESLFKRMSGAPDPQAAEMQARMEAALSQRQQQSDGTQTTPKGGRKTLGVAGKGGKVVKLVVPEGDGEGEQQKSTPPTTRRRKG